MVKKAGIVCCSNPLPEQHRRQNEQLCCTLGNLGIETKFSDCIYGYHSGEARAAELMKLYRDESVDAIFDISGGDIANEVLPYLDYGAIAGSGKKFWGYSDLTVILNAIYARTGECSILYQIKNLLSDESGGQLRRFDQWLRGNNELFCFNYRFIQGSAMEGIVVGGNIRCFLKLAGTPYFPDLTGKLLLLEAFGGEVPQMITYLSQLKQMGAFEKINGIILGTFTKMRQNGCSPSMEDLTARIAGTDIPIIKTEDVGHGADARAVVIGKHYAFEKRKL